MSSSLDSHMNFRMSVRDKKIIETAAKLKDLKPNTYAPQKLLEVAEKDIAEMSQINTLILNNSEWEKFIEIMEAPIKINKNLKKAITKFNKVNK